MFTNNMARILCILWFVGISVHAYALTFEKKLEDPVLEAVAIELFKQIRCVKCTSESIYESKSVIAQDLRHLVRQRIEAGDKTQDIFNYLQSRYGDEILMKPPFNRRTQPLWYLPAGFFLLGCAVLSLVLRKFRSNKDK